MFHPSVCPHCCNPNTALIHFVFQVGVGQSKSRPSAKASSACGPDNASMATWVMAQACITPHYLEYDMRPDFFYVASAGQHTYASCAGRLGCRWGALSFSQPLD